MRFHHYLALPALVAIVACDIPSGLLEGQSCPCLEGWFCNSEQICVEGERPDAGGTDGGGADAAPDAGGIATTCWRDRNGCDWTVPFDLVEGDSLELGDIDGVNFVFSPDGCTILYSQSGNIFFARRSGPDAPFRAAGEFEVNTEAAEDRATITPNGLELLFTREVDGITDVFRSRRASTTAAWPDAEVVNVLNAEELNTFDISLAPDGLSFYLSRPPALGELKDIQVAQRSSLAGEFNDPVSVSPISTSATSESEPSVAAGKTLMTFSSARNGDEQRQLYFSTRESSAVAWEPPRLVAGAFFDAGDEDEGPVSPDGCEVLVSRDGVVHRLLHTSR